MSRAPGPRGRLLTGSLAAFQRDPLALMTDAVRAHGDIVRFRFAHITAHLLNQPEAIEHVLSRQAANYHKNTRSAALIAATCGDSLMSGNSEAWARHRKLLAPVFQPRAVADYSALIDAHIQPMLTRWGQVVEGGGQIDIVAEMMDLVIAMAVRLLFSTEIDATRVESALSVLLNDTWRRLQAPFDPSMISAAFHRRDFKAARNLIDAIVTEMIRARRQSSDRPDDVLSRLLAAHEAEGAKALTDTELRDAAVTLLLAGHETTANALAWMFWLVASNAGQGFEASEPQHLFAEALRLYPSIWVIERRAVAADQIGPYRVPAGGTVLVSPWLLHRNPAYWPDPERFDPARFLPERVETRPRHAYLPFGLGPHRCIGLHLANLIASRVISNVYALFRLDAPDGAAPRLRPQITLRPDAPILLRPRLV
ncbi:cytochrome P450 [Paracoccus xiamenensis]|uniref:cytochrome P450 n=1 Tax=Paracoccus xiamenensis TaxID=2714901 RepID=UPI00140B7BC3|nr:cytochrome P450 [Paracoccus xiamenensis]NHF73173.1 cytochrome P450 [Paracoccus xiamenensis]